MIKGMDLNKKQWVSLSILMVLFLAKSFWPEGHTVVFNSYMKCVTLFSSVILNVFGLDTLVSKTTLLLDGGLQVDMVYGFLSLKLASLNAFTLIINKNFNYKKLALYLVWVTAINGVRLSILGAIEVGYFTSISFNHLNFYRSLLCLFPVLIYWREYRYMNNAALKFSVSDLFLKLSLILLVYYVLFFCVNFLGDRGTFFSDMLSKWILTLSSISLEYLGYNVEVAGRDLFNNQAAVFLGDGCIGINITLVFCSMYLFYETFSWRLLFYCFSGVVLVFVLNAMRITYLFVHLTEHGNDSALFNMHHDFYNIFIYSFIVLLWYLWFFYYKKEDSKDSKQ